MILTQFDLDGRTYQVRKMSAWEQFNVWRLYMPILTAGSKEAAQSLKENEDEDAVRSRQGKATIVAMAAAPQESVDFIMETCLPYCFTQKKGDSNWNPVYSGNKRMWSSDLDNGWLLWRLTQEVAGANLRPFFATKDSDSKDDKKPVSTGSESQNGTSGSSDQSPTISAKSNP